jgi:hypothetical protein
MEPNQLKNCHLCLGPHDNEIHEATLRLHMWLRREILRQITPWQQYRPVPHSEDAGSELPVAVGI